MPTPTTQFDYQAQPYWSEDGTYFPPGFDPHTGTWIDQAYEDAYAQGFVWDASIQNWVSLVPPAPDSAEEPLALGDARLEQALFDAILRAMRASPEATELDASADSDAEALVALATETTAATKALLDAIVYDADETTSFQYASPCPSAIELILSMLRGLVPSPDPSPLELLPEPAPLALLESMEKAAPMLAPAPAPTLFLSIADLTARSAIAPPVTCEVWAMLEGLDSDKAERALVDASHLPFDVSAVDLAEQAAQRDAATGIGDSEDVEIEIDLDVLSFSPELLPKPALTALERAALIQKLDLALGVLARARPGQLENTICLPLDAAVEAIHLPVFLEEKSSRSREPSLLLTPTPTPPVAPLRPPPTDQLKRASGSAVRAPASAPPKKPQIASEFIQIDTLTDVPSDDIELALMALANRVKRQSTSAPPQPVKAPIQRPGLSSGAPASRPPVLPVARPPASAISPNKPQLPLSVTVPQPLKHLSKRPAPAQAAGRQPSTVPTAALTPRYSLRSVSPLPSHVPVAIALNGTFRVLCRTSEGTVHRGTLRHPNLTAPTLTLEVQPGPTFLTLETGALQAIFFLRRPNQERPKPEGRKGRLLFKNGKQCSGLIPALDQNRSGFFFYPNEAEDSPTDFWFVYAAGLTSIDLE
ncbi:MAG: hypothetical protein LBM75_03250 [Myxococcales bacterium]|jgi:hypothetical protein|nr:hypothetical protein [Myxococcales bacterium]